MNSDPVYQDEETGRWYFWDETWSDCHGPYNTETMCRHKLDEYAKSIGYEKPSKLGTTNN